MKKLVLLLFVGLIIGIYYLWETDRVKVPPLLEKSISLQHQVAEVQLEVSTIESKNRIVKEGPAPHQAFHANAYSCSNCHESSNSLLMRASTCMACHDGTLGFYNVSEDKGESPFHRKENLNKNESEQEKVVLDVDNRELTCANCHNPHGSYSDRLLNNNPFGTATLTPENGGFLAKGKIYDYSNLVKTFNAFSGSFIGGSNNGVWFSSKDGSVEDTKIPLFILVRGSGAQLGLVSEGVPGDATAIMVYQYMERPATHRIPYRRGFYIPAKIPWLYGYDYGTPQNDYWTRFYTGESLPEEPVIETAQNGISHYKDIVDDNDQLWNEQLTFNYLKGYVYAMDDSLDSVITGEVAQTHSVTLETTEVKNLAGVSIKQSNLNSLNDLKLENNTKSTLGRLAIDITKYCSSCHLNYLAGKTTGKFSFAHQNFSDYDKWNCLKCHHSHDPIKNENEN